MRPPDLIHSFGVIQLNIQVLIDTLQCPADLDFVLKLNRDFVLDESLEETGVALVHYIIGRERGRHNGAFVDGVAGSCL